VSGNGGTSGSAGAQGGSSGKAGAGAGGAGMGGAGTGGAGTGGAGTGGAGTGGMGSLVTIDDFEDMNSQISLLGGGYWYKIDDMTSDGGAAQYTMVLLSPARGASTAGLHLTASGNTGYGAGVGADFVSSTSTKKAFDASGYTGITFWAKIASSTRAGVRFNVPDGGSDQAGGLCSGSASNQCNDHPGMAFSFTTSWVQYTALFSSLKTQGFGYPGSVRDITPNKVYGLNFTYAYPPAVNVDVLFDDISFISK
jgi:hypothetical protein